MHAGDCRIFLLPGFIRRRQILREPYCRRSTGLRSSVLALSQRPFPRVLHTARNPLDLARGKAGSELSGSVLLRMEVLCLTGALGQRCPESQPPSWRRLLSVVRGPQAVSADTLS